MANRHRSIGNLRPQFDEIYDTCIVGSGFCETDEYYRNEKERYWHSLELLCELNIPAPVRLLEIGGGQLAMLCKKLFGDDCTVGDISEEYVAPLRKEGINFVRLNLMDAKSIGTEEKFDIVVMLEVIEHIPIPDHIVIERVKSLLTPAGILFLTTPNLFRIRNVFRMIMGIDYLDHYMMPKPGQGLGHQIEYSAGHMRWQMEHAGMAITMLKHERMGRTGHSLATRLGRRLLAPLLLRPAWRDCLAVAARKSTDSHDTAPNRPHVST